MTPNATLIFLLATILIALAPAVKPADQPAAHQLTLADIERWMTELSNWGRWGKEDQMGTVNLITPAKRKRRPAW